MDDNLPVPHEGEGDDSSFQEIAREYYEKLEGPFRRDGLFLDAVLIQEMPPEFEGGPPKAALIMSARIGSAAWSDRVQKPDKAKVDREVKRLENQMVADDFEELRRKLAERAAGVEDPLSIIGEKEEDDGPNPSED